MKLNADIGLSTKASAFSVTVNVCGANEIGDILDGVFPQQKFDVFNGQNRLHLILAKLAQIRAVFYGLGNQLSA